MPDQPMQTEVVVQAMPVLPDVSVIGLGKLGTPMAAVFAAAGMNVVGFDLNTDFVNKVANGIAPVEETGLQAVMDATDGRLTAVAEVEVAIARSDVTFVIVPTPCDANGEFSNDYVVAAVERIGQAIARKSTPHLVVVTSTVMPGSTGSIIQKTLEEASGRLVGSEGLGLCYSPEFIALGSVVRDMRYPDFILIGESDVRAGDLLAKIYAASCENEPQMYRMNFVNAELTKISVNTFVTTKISYANMLADICSKLPGSDVDVVTNAVGADSRIGKKYLKGAVAYGGPCFPRDNRAFSALGDRIGADCGLAKATDALNTGQVTRLLDAIHRYAPRARRVAVLGLSYKPDTHVIEQSAGMDVLLALIAREQDVVGYDPMANAEAIRIVGSEKVISDHLDAALCEADVAILTTPWAEFSALPKHLQGRESPILILDPWRMLNAADLPDNASLISLGRSI